MHIQLLIDASSARRWHLELVDSLRRRASTSASVRLIDASAHVPYPRADRLFAFERRLHGLDRGRSAFVGRDALSAYIDLDSVADLAIDLVGGLPESHTPAWRLRFDGHVGVEGAISSLVAGRFPVVTLDDLRTGQQVAGGRPGSGSPGVVVASFEDMLAGCTTLVHAALDGAAPRTAITTTRPPIARPSSLLRHGLGEAVSAFAHMAYRRLFRAPHWRIGWRFVDDDDVVDLGSHPHTGWRDLPDDGHHFYADPFPIVVGHDTYLFVEDFDHRVGRGVISVLPFDDDGPVGTPEPVLTHDVHLSYPFVFEAEGQVWMIPETSEARRVEIYRAHAFPHSWIRERVLLDDVEANDVTILRHEGKWWMSATVRTDGSHSDTLHLWHSDRLLGHWTAHPLNPVVVDIGSARPAGRIVARDGRLIRPVQDCTAGYGAALGLMEIVRLDETGFEQRPVAHLTAGPHWAGRRMHTLNRAGRLECIDGSRLSPRIRIRARNRGASA